MKKNKIFAMMAAAMTFAACSTSDITSDYSFDDDKNTVTVSSVTRAGENQTTTPSTTVDMYESFLLTNLTQKEKAGYNYEAIFEYNNNVWEPSEKVMWYGSGDNVFQATYPCATKNGYQLQNIEFDKFMIPGYQYNNSDSIPDWMRATETVARNNGALNLEFKHMLSKVTVVIDYNNISLDGNSVTSASVSKIFTRVQYCEAVTGEDGKVTINPYQKTDYDTDGLYVWTTAQSDADNKKASTTAIVAPGAYTNIAKVSVSYEGRSEEIVLYLPAGSTLEAGKHYTFTLSSATITHKEATISSVSVEPWTEGTITGTKPAEKIIPYVTFKSNEEVKFMMRTEEYTISGLEYSVNNGEWIPIPSHGISEGEVTFGGSKGNLRLRGKNLYGTADVIYPTFNVYIYSTISFSSNDTNAKVACTGDIRTLLDYENYNTVDTKDARFCSLFENCTLLTSAPELPATTLADGCYQDMFNGCTSLTTAPELPATTLADNCYFCMFEGCTSLTTAPELKATTLEESCYTSMFEGCTSLTTAPKLPATTLAWQCYCRMFEGCILLETAPELPATTLAESCYSNMFNGCTSLTTAPKLKATTLASTCYISMFEKCTKLESVTMLATDGFDKSDCLYKWLNDAGKDATSRKLKVNSETEYEAIKSNLPSEYWQIGKATILDKDNNEITSSTNQ